MTAPRWFYLTLAACAIALTVAGVMAMRWKPLAGAVFLDRYRARVCTINGCTPVGALPEDPRLQRLRELVR